MLDQQTGQTAIDPERPWITDPDEAPARMSWVQTLFNPTGRSPKLHFTRAWTLLFFVQFLVIVGVYLLSFFTSIAGGDSSPVTKYGQYAIVAVFATTPILSLIIHMRRLRDAGRSLGWAALLVLPMIVGLLFFSNGVMQKSKEYDALYQKRGEYLADPQAWQDKQFEERRKEQARRAQARQAGTDEPDEPAARRGRPGGAQERRDLDMDQPLPSQTEFVLEPNLMRLPMGVIFVKALLILWSLLWLARLPSVKPEA